MPITVTCDKCSESHRVKDDAVGKKFKCKGCDKTLVIVAPPPPEDDFGNFDEADDYDGEYRPKLPKRKATPKKSTKAKPDKFKPVSIHLTSVPLGIDCVFYGFVLYCLCYLIGFAVAWSKQGNPLWAIQTFRFLMFGMIASTIINSVGKLACLTAPSQMSGRGSLFVAVAFDLLLLSINVASQVTVVPSPLKTAVQLLSIAGSVCFIVFLQHLGDLLGERDLRERGTGVFKMGIGIVVLIVLQYGLVFAGLAIGLPAFLVVGLGFMLLFYVLVVVGIIFVIQYGGLLLACRYALSNA